MDNLLKFTSMARAFLSVGAASSWRSMAMAIADSSTTDCLSVISKIPDRITSSSAWKQKRGKSHFKHTITRVRGEQDSQKAHYLPCTKYLRVRSAPELLKNKGPNAHKNRKKQKQKQKQWCRSTVDTRVHRATRFMRPQQNLNARPHSGWVSAKTISVAAGCHVDQSRRFAASISTSIFRSRFRFRSEINVFVQDPPSTRTRPGFLHTRRRARNNRERTGRKLNLHPLAGRKTKTKRTAVAK